MMSGGRMNAAASDDFPFAAMQQPPYVGFEHAGMVQAGGGGGGQRHQGAMMYDNFDFAAAAAAFGQFQDATHHQMLALPPNGSGAGGLLPMAPPPIPGMQLQMPPMGMHGHGDVYPALGMVKREGGGGAADAGRIGLNLGRRTYYSPGDMMAVDRLLMRSRLGGVFGLGFGGAHHQPPRCQAEGCKADLSGAKHYHRRHKVCEYHAKASLVAAAGKQQRFCQQCSRFHVLTEFDEAKRSCRKRLAEHNRRRRKPASGSTTATSKDSAPPSKKPNPGAISSSYAADNNNLSTTKSTISSNTSAISCLQHHDQSKAAAAAARPMTLTLGEPREKDDHQHLSNAMQLHHHHQEQQHFITSLLQQNNNGNGNGNSNILSCSSVCSSGLPSAGAANGEVSDQNNTSNHGGGNNNNNNMHLFEVDFM